VIISKSVVKSVAKVFFVVGLSLVLVFYTLFYVISKSESDQFYQALSYLSQNNMVQAEKTFLDVYNNYSSKTGKDAYQRVSLIGLAVIRIDNKDDEKLAGVLNHIEKSYKIEAKENVVIMLDKYKKTKVIDSEAYVPNRKKERGLFLEYCKVVSGGM
jgi:hypothetical protein